MHQTLGQYISATADGILRKVYMEISKSYKKPAPDEENGLQDQLTAVRRTLVEKKRATGLEFLCFRANKTDQGREKDREQKLEKERGERQRLKSGDSSSMKDRERDKARR
jgi:exocyst complex component 2